MEEDRQVSINITLPCYREILNENCAKRLLNLFHGWNIISYDGDVIDSLNDYKILLCNNEQVCLENETSSIIERVRFKPSNIIFESKNKNDMPFDIYASGLNNVDIFKEIWHVFADFGQKYISEAEINLRDTLSEYQCACIKNMLNDFITFRKINIYTEIDGQENMPCYTYGYTMNYNLSDIENIYATIYVAAVTETDNNLTMDDIVNFNASVYKQVRTLKTYMQ